MVPRQKFMHDVIGESECSKLGAREAPHGSANPNIGNLIKSLQREPTDDVV